MVDVNKLHPRVCDFDRWQARNYGGLDGKWWLSKLLPGEIECLAPSKWSIYPGVDCSPGAQPWMSRDPRIYGHHSSVEGSTLETVVPSHPRRLLGTKICGTLNIMTGVRKARCTNDRGRAEPAREIPALLSTTISAITLSMLQFCFMESYC